MTHSARASAALRALQEDDPAIAALSLWCAHRDSATGLAETQGDTIRYGPAFDRLAPHEQAGLAAHHVLHVALRHPARMAEMALRFGPGFDARLFGIAADAVVNEAVLLAGHALPRPALVLTGLLSQALGILQSPREALAEWDVERLYLRLIQGGSGGEAATRARAEAATRAPDQDLHPEPDPAAEPARATKAEWRQHLARAIDAGRLAGRGFGAIGHRMADAAPAPTPWEVLLRGLLARTLLPRAGLTHRRPARDWIAEEAEARATSAPTPAFRPGRARATPAPRIALALDTSSSVDDARLAMLWAEIAAIARRVAAEIWLIPFDEAPEAPRRLDPAERLEGIAMRRGGGTDFGPALAAALALRPSVIVVLTDLEADAPDAPRGVPVIWAATGEAPDPPFGHVLRIDR